MKGGNNCYGPDYWKVLQMEKARKQSRIMFHMIRRAADRLNGYQILQLRRSWRDSRWLFEAIFRYASDLSSYQMRELRALWRLNRDVFSDCLERKPSWRDMREIRLNIERHGPLSAGTNRTGHARSKQQSAKQGARL